MLEDTQTHPQELVDDGMRQTRERCLRELPPPYFALGEQAFDTAHELLSRDEVQALWTEWPDRAARVFIELVVIGTYARVLKGEPALTFVDLKNLIEWIETILNSWTHR